jgi:2-polyprenyl-6-hydroxyphenyl methylase/3-demethylubiquinone-9 3-methyltransferase
MSSRFVNKEAAAQAGERVGFSFGENWSKYVERLTDAKIEQAAESMVEAFAPHRLDGRGFIDIGSGSGLFSFAAHRLGAGPIVSVDVDPESVACTTYLRTRAGDPAGWEVKRGSVLDPAFLGSLGTADRVYSWGVLHHTGAMWTALDAVLTLIAPGGAACIALYNRPRRPGLHMRLKRTYNRLPRLLRPVMAGAYAAAYVVRLLTTGRNPVRFVRSYAEASRGMSFWRDIEDWLGGLPYEFAEPNEVEAHVTGRGFRVSKTTVRPPGANNEYLIEHQ